MKSRLLTGTTCVITLLAIAPGALFALAPEYSDSADASKLLMQVQFSAAQLDRDAATLHSYSRLGLTRESHFRQVNLVKQHINNIGARLARLQLIRDAAAPWQQEAIDSITPAASDVARHTQAAILHLNNRGNSLWDAGYHDNLRAISDRSGDVKEIIDLHLAMADTRSRMERLRDRAVTLGSEN